MIDRDQPIEQMLLVDGISKSFGDRRVIDQVNLSVNSGELLALAGHNGSGKSTLVKILAGYYKPDPGGEIRINGELLQHRGRRSQNGLAFVHQDLALVESATVLENICLARYPTHSWGGISWKQTRRHVQALLDRMEIEVPLDVPVGTVDATTKAILAIARAVDSLEEQGIGLLVLDEPTAYLPEDGADRLFSLLKVFCDRGNGVLIVTHDVADITRRIDSVAVLRDGRCVYHGPTKDLPLEDLVKLILIQPSAPVSKGQIEQATEESTLVAASPRASSSSLRIRGLVVDNVRVDDLHVEPGEILGLTGLVGSGYAAPLYAIFDGRHRDAGGEVELNGETFALRHTDPSMMVRNRVALVPADRINKGGVQGVSIRENASLLCMSRVRRRGYRISRSSETNLVESILETNGVLGAAPEYDLQQLSGGNQQKLILGKWLITNPRVLLLDEPTHGMDVGACEGVFTQIRTACRAGISIMIASSDADVLAELCNRVAIMRHGRIVRTLVGADVTESNIASGIG